MSGTGEPLGVIGAIIDTNGGLRVIISNDEVWPNVGPGERLFVVPNIKVRVPLAWDRLPWAIKLAARYAVKQLRAEGKNYVPFEDYAS